MGDHSTDGDDDDEDDGSDDGSADKFSVFLWGKVNVGVVEPIPRLKTGQSAVMTLSLKTKLMDPLRAPPDRSGTGGRLDVGLAAPKEGLSATSAVMEADKTQMMRVSDMKCNWKTQNSEVCVCGRPSYLCGGV